MAIGVEELTMLALARKYTNKKMAEAHNLHLHWKIVDEVPSAEEANSHTIYLYKIPDAYGDDKYEEWMLIDGEMAKIGETSVDLRDQIYLLIIIHLMEM